MAKRNTTRKSKRNLDPLTAMTLAQGTGLDTALLGRKGFRALTDKRTYTGRNPEDIELLNDMTPQASVGHIEFTPDGIERFARGGYVYQAFMATPVFADGYRMGTPEEAVSEFAQRNPAKYERCVRAVQARGGANGYAVCTAMGLRNKRRNPAAEADAVYEEFHGVPPEETLAIRETEHFHGHLAGLGDLVLIRIKLSGGSGAGQFITLNAPDPDRVPKEDVVRTACNEAKNQLYLVGGDQSIDVKKLGFRDSFDINHDGETFEATELKDLMVLGEINKLTYRTQKAFDQFELVDYFHKLGEDTKSRPFLLYDTMNSRMKIAGGEYTIKDVGIVN